jgi:hypothetical protein
MTAASMYLNSTTGVDDHAAQNTIAGRPAPGA